MVSTVPSSQKRFLQSGLGPGQEYEVSISVVKNNATGPPAIQRVTTSEFGLNPLLFPTMLHGECGDFGVDLVSTIKVSRLTWSWLLKALLSLEFPAFKISVLTWSQAIKVSLLVSQVFLLLP